LAALFVFLDTILEKGFIRAQRTSCALFFVERESGSQKKLGGLVSKKHPRPVNRILMGPHSEMSEDVIIVNAVGSRRGDAAEAEFMVRACGLDFRVAKPWGNIDPYDVLVGFGRGFWRIQVKCAYRGKYGQYEVNVSNTRAAYTKEEIDFVAAWVVQKNVWYIIPAEAVEGCRLMNFDLGKKGRKKKRDLENYREAWCLLKCPPEARGWKDIPVICRCRGQLPVRCVVCPTGQLR
jgi:PD-(D/E)XK endonuclease